MSTKNRGGDSRIETMGDTMAQHVEDKTNSAGQDTFFGRVMRVSGSAHDGWQRMGIDRSYQVAAQDVNVPRSQNEHQAQYRARTARLQTALDGDQNFAEMQAELQHEADARHDKAVRRLFTGD